jgi:hypothetical protein
MSSLLIPQLPGDRTARHDNRHDTTSHDSDSPDASNFDTCMLGESTPNAHVAHWQSCQTDSCFASTSIPFRWMPLTRFPLPASASSHPDTFSSSGRISVWPCFNGWHWGLSGALAPHDSAMEYTHHIRDLSSQSDG